ncbi:unnamed protein product, partial [Chrysoparadoxa australica]
MRNGWGIRQRMVPVLCFFGVVCCAVFVAAKSEYPPSFPDPWNHFCGGDECYAILGVEQPPRGGYPEGEKINKSEIRKNYRALSLEWHPDKHPDKKYAKEKFAKIAKAYEVLINDEKRLKYDGFMEAPDTYWEEYGTFVVFAYAKESDWRLVVLGLLLVWSISAPAIQQGKYRRAVKFLIHAAENNLGKNNGGTPTTLKLRQQAEQVLADREKASTSARAVKGKGSGKVSQRKGKEGKEKKMKKRGEQYQKDLSEVIHELAHEVDIKGGYRKASWNDVPVVWLAKMPFDLGKAGYYYVRYLVFKGKLTKRDDLFWTRRKVGGSTWDGLTEDAHEAALEEKIWANPSAFEDWKLIYLFGEDPRDVKRRK